MLKSCCGPAARVAALQRLPAVRFVLISEERAVHVDGVFRPSRNVLTPLHDVHGRSTVVACIGEAFQLHLEGSGAVRGVTLRCICVNAIQFDSPVCISLTMLPRRMRALQHTIIGAVCSVLGPRKRTQVRLRPALAAVARSEAAKYR